MKETGVCVAYVVETCMCISYLAQTVLGFAGWLLLLSSFVFVAYFGHDAVDARRRQACVLCQQLVLMCFCISHVGQASHALCSTCTALACLQGVQYNSSNITRRG